MRKDTCAGWKVARPEKTRQGLKQLQGVATKEKYGVARPEKTRQGLKLLTSINCHLLLIGLQGLKKPDRD